MSSQGKQAFNEMLKEITTIVDDDDDIDVAIKEEGIDCSQNKDFTPSRPAVKTPPSSQRASRGGTGIQYGSHAHATPSSSKTRESCKVEDIFLLDSSDEDDKKRMLSTTSKKRKQGGTPNKPSSKWEDWEDRIILKAVLLNGIDKCDWKGVLQAINLQRPGTDPRTAKAVSCHWSSLKSRLLD